MAEEEQKGGEKLEDKVKDKDSKSFITKAAKLGFLGAAALGTTALGLATVGIAAPIIGGAVGAGLMAGTLMRGKTSFTDTLVAGLKSYSAINAVLYPIIGLGNLTYPIIGSLGSSIAGGIGSVVAKSAYALTAYNAAFAGMYKAADHLLDHYLNPIGIMDSISKNFAAEAKRFALLFSPGYILTANGITDIVLAGYNVPVFAANALPGMIYSGLYPLEENKAYKKAAKKPAQHPAPMQGMPQLAHGGA